MGFVTKNASLLRTLHAASPSALVQLLPELSKASISASLQVELTRKFLQSAPFFSTSQICHLTHNYDLLSFNPALSGRLHELIIDSIQFFTPAECIDLLKTKHDEKVSLAILARAESIDWTSAKLSEAQVAKLAQGIKNLEISENFRSTLSDLMEINAKKFSSLSAAQIAIAGGKMKLPINPKTAETISDRMESPRHMANAIFGFSRWPQVPGDIIFGLIKKMNLSALNAIEMNQVLSAMITRKLPAHKFFSKAVRCLSGGSALSGDLSTVLMLQAATQIKGLKSPGLNFYLEVLPRKFSETLDRKTASLILTGYSLAGVVPPGNLRTEILRTIRSEADLKWEISDVCSMARLLRFSDDPEIRAVFDLLISRLNQSPVPKTPDEVVNVLLALGRLGAAPVRKELAQKYLQVVRTFHALSGARRVNVLYAVTKCLPDREIEDLETCREIACKVSSTELNEHLRASFQEALEALGLDSQPQHQGGASR